MALALAMISFAYHVYQERLLSNSAYALFQGKETGS